MYSNPKLALSNKYNNLHRNFHSAKFYFRKISLLLDLYMVFEKIFAYLNYIKLLHRLFFAPKTQYAPLFTKSTAYFIANRRNLAYNLPPQISVGWDLSHLFIFLHSAGKAAFIKFYATFRYFKTA